MDAPTPKAIMRRTDEFRTDVCEIVDFYGYEYHGKMDHKMSESILKNSPDGSYLIRSSPAATDFYTLTLRFNAHTKHYKIYYKPNLGHFLKEDFKRFETIHDLVADGLISFYMQIHAAPIIQSMMSQTRNCYQQSPYMTLNRRKLRALSNDMRKSLKFTEVTDSSSKQMTIANDLPNESNSTSTTNGVAQEEEILPIIYEKSHNFKVHTFKGLNWCEFCANFLWGFTAQGVKCEGNIY